MIDHPARVIAAAVPCPMSICRTPRWHHCFVAPLTGYNGALGVHQERADAYARWLESLPSPLRLNLGACDTRIPGFMSIDKCEPADFLTDLSLTWPWPDSSVSEVIAHDIIEHLPDRIHTMNELHRVLRPGAAAYIITPDASKGPGYFQDPTHCAPWCMNSWQYFEEGSVAQKRFSKAYGITARFKIVSLEPILAHDVVEDVWKIQVVLEAGNKPC